MSSMERGEDPITFVVNAVNDLLQRVDRRER